jgi:hypothetical protein
VKGLCGGHRTGKTSLARTYAEKYGALFVETPTSAIFRELGLDPAQRFTFSERLAIQEVILQRTDELVYAAVPVGVDAIADRTPLDMLAYTMAEAVGDAVQPEDQERFARYANACFDITNKRFSMVVLVQPGIPLQHTSGKAVANAAYIEHLNSLILGLCVDQRMKTSHFYIPRQNLEMEDRLRCLINASNRAEGYAQQDLQNHILLGGVLQ